MKRLKLDNARPLAYAYLAAVRKGLMTRAELEGQIIAAAEYILRCGASGSTADVLRNVAALCEAVAELKEQEAE